MCVGMYVLENLRSLNHMTDFYENCAIIGHPQLTRVLPSINNKNMVDERPCKAEEELALFIVRG